MGVVEEVIADICVKDRNYVFELNEGETVHIHFDDIRIDMTRQDFKKFISSVKEAKNKVEEDKNV